jgi:hypothetical protein
MAIDANVRHKITSTASCVVKRQVKSDYGKPGGKYDDQFDVEIDLPVGGNGPYKRNAPITVTGTYQPKTGVTLTASSTGGVSPGPVTYPTDPGNPKAPWHWSVTFNVPNADGDYLFSIEGDYIPAGSPLATTIICSAGYTVSGS